MIKPKVYETNIMLLNAKTEEELKMLVAQNPAIGTVVDRLERISSDIKFQHQALVREKAIRDHYSSLSTAERRGIDKGRIEGRLEGRIEGRAEGRIEGIEKGEYNKSIAIAKNLLVMNFNIDDIRKATGLSKEQIENIKYQL